MEVTTPVDIESSVGSLPVTIPLTRLRALEDLEARLPALIDAAVTTALEQKKRERLTKLVGDPSEHARKQLEKYYKNRDAINARRRAAYKAKKEAGAF
jgi:hypothetical protein